MKDVKTIKTLDNLSDTEIYNRMDGKSSCTEEAKRTVEAISRVRKMPALISCIRGDIK